MRGGKSITYYSKNISLLNIHYKNDKFRRSKSSDKFCGRNALLSNIQSDSYCINKGCVNYTNINWGCSIIKGHSNSIMCRQDMPKSEWLWWKNDKKRTGMNTLYSYVDK